MFCIGQLVLSGSTNGVVIATDLYKGVTTTVISDHKGSIITDIDITRYSVTVRVTPHNFLINYITLATRCSNS